MDDISIVLCGTAGQGVQTVEQFLVYLFKISGYNVFATKEYMSRVRGGINSTELRIGTKKVSAFVDRIDIFVPIHKNSMQHISHRLSENTVIIGDPSTVDKNLIRNPDNVFELDFIRIVIYFCATLYVISLVLDLSAIVQSIGFFSFL